MLKNCLLTRNILYSYFYPMGTKCVFRFANIFELFERELEKKFLENLVLPINPNQSKPICILLRGINKTSCDMKEKKDKNDKKAKCEKTNKKTKNNEKEKIGNKLKNEQNKKKSSKSNEENNKDSLNENPCKGKENLVGLLYKAHDIRLEERKKPKPGPGEVLVAMNCVGLSSSDMNYYTKGQLLTSLVLGHEGTGIVAVLGEGVRNLREGDRVVIQPNVHCGQCEFCKSCQHHLCSCPKLCGLTPHDGLLTCYFAHNATYCHKLPENLTMEEGVLMNMLANGINVCSRCPLCIGATVLVIGAGPTGLISLIAAKAMGATNTCVMCKFPNRLQLAKQYETKTVQICNNAQPEDMAQNVRDELGCAPKITIDSVGSESSIKLAIASTASGGSIVLTNITGEEHKIPLNDVVNRDISIRSALRHSNKFPAAIALANSGSINLKPLISHHFFFEKVSEAFDTMVENQENVNKIIVHIRPRDRNNKNPF